MTFPAEMDLFQEAALDFCFPFDGLKDNPVRIPEIHDQLGRPLLRLAMDLIPIVKKSFVEPMDIVCLEAHVGCAYITGLVIFQWFSRWHVFDQFKNAYPDA